MKKILAVPLLCLAPAWASAQMVRDLPAQPPCADCGVIWSIRATTRQDMLSSDAVKPSGLALIVPLGGGKTEVGSSTRVGRDRVQEITTWEIIVRRDDGRYTLVQAEDPEDWREGDKVRLDRGRLVRRSD